MAVTKRDLIEKLVKNDCGRELSKAAAADLVQSMFDNLGLALRRGRRFSYPGFGTFIVRKRKERQARNPKTGEIMNISSSKTVIFRPASTVKQLLN